MLGLNARQTMLVVGAWAVVVFAMCAGILGGYSLGYRAGSQDVLASVGGGN